MTEQLLEAASDEANGLTRTESAMTNVASHLPLAKNDSHEKVLRFHFTI